MSSSGNRAEATEPISRISGPSTQLPLAGSWSSSPSAASELSSRCTVGRVSPDSLTSSTSGDPSGFRPTMRSRDATRLTTCAPWTGVEVIISSKVGADHTKASTLWMVHSLPSTL